jgi:hypothetical protein
MGYLYYRATNRRTWCVCNPRYHANFAVYLNGKREAFKGAQYYQEVAVCSGSHHLQKPEQRAHMHENVSDVVHIHDDLVTWGQFFNSLGWTISSDIVETDSGTKYVADGSNKVHVIIDGQNKSRVLISYGPDNQTELKKQFESIAKTAEKQNQSKDPASCAGSEEIPFKERLKHVL